MKKTLAVLVLSSVCLSAQDKQLFRSGAERIVVDATVVDGKGQPIAGLTAEDFELTIDNQPRAIVSAEYVAQPPAANAAASLESRGFSSNEDSHGRLILFVVDQGNISLAGVRPIVAAAGRMMDKLAAGDRIGLVTVPGPGPSVEFTADRTIVRDALNKIVGQAEWRDRGLTYNIGISEAIEAERRGGNMVQTMVNRECGRLTGLDRQVCEMTIVAEARQQAQALAIQTTRSLSAFFGTLRALGSIDGPKTVIWVGEGLVLPSDRDSEIRRVADEAAAARATIYTLALDRSLFDASQSRISPTMMEDRSILADGLEQLAGLTRGALFTIVGTGDNELGRIATELSGYYLLGVDSEARDRDGKTHAIRLRVKRSGATVRARREFSVAPTDGAATTLPADAGRVTRMLTSLVPMRELPLKVATYCLPEAGGKVRVLISSEIGRDQSAGGELSIGYVIFEPAGRIVSSGEVKTKAALVPGRASGPWHHVFSATLTPGAYTLRLATVDPQGRAGSVEHPLRAELTKRGPLAMSDLLLTAATGTATLPPAQTHVQTGTLGAYVEIGGDDPKQTQKLDVTLEILDPSTTLGAGPSTSLGPGERDATPLMKVPLRLAAAKSGVAGAVTAQSLVSLANLPPGDYIARANVSQGGRSVGTVSRPFSVGRTIAGRASLAPTGRTAAGGATVRGGGVGAELARPDMKLALPARTFDVRQVLEPSLVTRYRDRAAEAQVAEPFSQGLALLEKGDYENASRQFKRAVGMSSDFLPATIYIGAAYAARGQEREAIGAWNTSLVSEHKEPLIFELLADALLRINEPDEALDLLAEPSREWPDADAFVRLRGLALAQLRKPDDALQLLAPYLEKHGDDRDALFSAMRMLYERAQAPGADKRADLAQFVRYEKQYETAGGTERRLVQQWRRFLEK